MGHKPARFSVGHVPQYSRVLLELVFSPSFLYFFLAGNTTMLVCGFGFYHFEQGVNPHVQSYFDALWWSLTTITTVGYGDISPVTIPGRAVGMVLMAAGVVFFVGATALLVSAFFARTEKEIEQELDDADERTHRELARVLEELARVRALLESQGHGKQGPSTEN